MALAREIVMDLLPLYVSMELPNFGDVPQPISKEVEMEAYKRANWVNAVRTIVLALVLSGTILTVVLVVPLIIELLK
jgi:hypothetical protein